MNLNTAQIDNKYQEWIDYSVGCPENNCEKYSKRMVEFFPELILVRGWFYENYTRTVEHWWCKTAEGSIVDPTAHQFFGFVLKDMYKEHKEGDPEPTGKCPNCGGYSYNGATCCSEKCHKEYVEYITNPNY